MRTIWEYEASGEGARQRRIWSAGIGAKQARQIKIDATIDVAAFFSLALIGGFAGAGMITAFVLAFIGNI